MKKPLILLHYASNTSHPSDSFVADKKKSTFPIFIDSVSQIKFFTRI